MSPKDAHRTQRVGARASRIVGALSGVGHTKKDFPEAGDSGAVAGIGRIIEESLTLGAVSWGKREFRCKVMTA